MSTMYYIRNTMNRNDDIIIGYNSGKCGFIFNIYCKTYKEWVKLITQYYYCIYDEYDRRVDAKQLLWLIHNGQINLPLYLPEDAEYFYIDIDGYTFSKWELT